MTGGVETEDGFASLEPGMAVTAEVKTGRRSVISYLLSPLSGFRQEGLREMRNKWVRHRRFDVFAIMRFVLISIAIYCGSFYCCFAEDPFQLRLIGDWIVTDVKLKASDDVQIDNRDELLGKHLLISRDFVQWLPRLESPDIEAKPCRKPEFVIQTVSIKPLLYTIVCNDGRVLGNRSKVSIISNDMISLTWFDDETLLLRRKVPIQ